MGKFRFIVSFLFLLVGCQDKFTNFNPMAPYFDAIKQGARPTIHLKGDNPLSLPAGEAYIEPGYEVRDAFGVLLDQAVVIENQPNTQVPGTYVVRYKLPEHETTRVVKVLAQPATPSTGEIIARAYPEHAPSPYEYFEYLPQGYSQNSKPYPLIIFLHGVGEKGGVNSSGKRTGVALEKVLGHGPLKRVKSGKHLPAIIVQPQSPEWWNTGKLKEFLEVMKSRYRVDQQRIYLTGLSMGGGGVWDFARAYPQEFAAIVPICGASSISSKAAAAPLMSLPIWAFHAKGDKTVPVSNSYSFLNFIFQNYTNKSEPLTNYYAASSTSTKTVAIEHQQVWIVYEGVNPGSTQRKLLTIYPHGNHDSWTETYNNQKMWDWLFQQSR